MKIRYRALAGLLRCTVFLEIDLPGKNYGRALERLYAITDEDAAALRVRMRDSVWASATDRMEWCDPMRWGPKPNTCTADVGRGPAGLGRGNGGPAAIDLRFSRPG